MGSADISRVYLFLAKQGGIMAADQNGDGTVIKAEFASFMLDNVNEWNGESSKSTPNDIINEFWRSIDTNRSGTAASGLKNKNSLDKKEMEKMETKIEAYTILNDFADKLDVPGIISNTSNWKNSVVESLSASVDSYIKKNGLNGLEEYLEEISPFAEAKTTADYYANEYITKVLSDVSGYKSASDDTLKGMIDAYVKEIIKEFNESKTVPDESEIQETINGLINAYLATANLGNERAVTADLGDYGYKPDDKSPLNDLQKAVLTTKLTSVVAKEADYDKYKEIYDSAVTSFLESLKYGDFNTVNTNALAEFKKSDPYKAIEVRKLAISEEMNNAIKAISADFAEKIKGVMAGEVPEYEDIINRAAEKAQNGEFNDRDGKLDKDKFQKWFIGELQKIMGSFYTSGLDEMSLTELEKTYNALIKSAEDNNDAQAIKDAAIKYCDAVKAKSPAYENAIRQVFYTDDYSAKINSLYANDVKKYMEKLIAKINELGDVDTDFKENSNGTRTVSPNPFNALKDTSIYLGTTKPIATLTKDLTVNGHTYDATRIRYESLDNNLIIDNNTGEVTVNPNIQPGGPYASTVVLYVDGKEITSHTVKITVKKVDTIEDILNNPGVANTTSWGGNSSEDLYIYGTDNDHTKVGTLKIHKKLTDMDFKSLYNNNAIIQLYSSDKTDGDWNQFKKSSTVIDQVKQLIKFIGNVLENAGLDTSKLQTAVQNVQKRYSNTSNWEPHKNRFDDSRGNYCANKIQSGEYSSDTIVKQQDDIKNGGDKIVYMVSFKGLVDAILAEYQALFS